MRNLLLILLLSSFSSLFSQSELVFKSKKIENYTLEKILNNGVKYNLNDSNPNIGSGLSLILYSVGINMPAYETEMIVGHEYYLAVSEYDEYPDQAVFYLGKFGQLKNVKWFDFKKSDTAKIKFDIVNHPKYILEIDPELKKVTKSIIIQITISKITIIE